MTPEEEESAKKIIRNIQKTPEHIAFMKLCKAKDLRDEYDRNINFPNLTLIEYQKLLDQANEIQYATEFKKTKNGFFYAMKPFILNKN